MFITIGYVKSNSKVIKKIEYRYIQNTPLEKQFNPLRVTDNFNGMFNDVSAWQKAVGYVDDEYYAKQIDNWKQTC